MQGFLILAIIGTDKDTLEFYSKKNVDGPMDGRTDAQTNVWKVELLYRTLL